MHWKIYYPPTRVSRKSKRQAIWLAFFAVLIAFLSSFVSQDIADDGGAVGGAFLVFDFAEEEFGCAD